jgi:hypothetical protein
MKAFLCLTLVFAACAWADEAADRQAIEHVIALLNEHSPPAALFTADSDGRAALERLHPWDRDRVRRPAVVISHEPWGEANISWIAPCGPIVSRSVRFITPEVALADAGCGDLQLLVVMKKEGTDWKIASARVLAPR